MQCPRCQHENPTGTDFCGKCGTPLQRPDGRPFLGPSYADLRRELTEAREQQTATSEILRAISASQTEAQPVFDAIADSVMRLFHAYGAGVYYFDGEYVHIVAVRGGSQGSAQHLREQGPYSVSRDTPIRGCFVDGSITHIADIDREDLSSENREMARVRGWRALLAVPMLREGRPIGVIAVTRAEAGAFSVAAIALLQTFADQAVIAIENVRLFTELQEKNEALTKALDQQTATSDILKVISRSPTDVQPVFDAIVRAAVQLCHAVQSNVQLFDGQLMHYVAQHNIAPAAMEVIHRLYPMPPNRSQTASRAVLNRGVVHVPDVLDDREYVREMALKGGWRSVLSVPMNGMGRPIGAITVARMEPGPFSETEIALRQTFADQAVIAIENVRLFKELEARNRDLTTALDQQTATSEILRAITHEPTDTQPVFDTIVRNAVRLCGAVYGTVSRSDGVSIQLVAHYNLTPEQIERVQRTFPRSLGDRGATERAIRTGAVVCVADLDAEPDVVSAEMRAQMRDLGVRSALAVPMLRQQEAIGSINVTHRAVGAFTDAHVELLKTFADQAVIAIENVRLFKQLEAANRELAAASQHKSEFLANMSHELRTPLNAIIGFSEVLSEKMFGELNEKQEEYSKDIHASGQHLLSLINDILDLSKIEAGRMELELSEFDLPTALDNALMLVRERAQRRSLTLNKEVDAGVVQIQGDERKIRQVVLNLLSNAIKFTPEGGRIEVGAEAKDGFVEVTVSDTGVGIAPEDQEKVFEEFRQVGTADKKAEGTGLGLTLCRKFIELHGGKIWVKSQVGVGSTFTFTIPVRGGA